MEIDSYPLCWPAGWKRTTARRKSQFKTSFGKARDSIFKELNRMGVGDWNIILSTNMPVKSDGRPFANRVPPADPGVAVYFKRNGKQIVLACDTYPTVADNMRAIAATVEALRGIERWGASDMLERAFTGFQALPAPAAIVPWYNILGVPKLASAEQIKAAWREQLKIHHPDVGGSQAKLIEINEAYKEGMANL